MKRHAMNPVAAEVSPRDLRHREDQRRLASAITAWSAVANAWIVRSAATWLGLTLSAIPDVLREDFSTTPFHAAGWQVHGDSAHFTWDHAAGKLRVLWNSSRPNAFCYRPLPTVLTRSESFRFRFKLALEEIRTEPPGSTFQLALGLIRRSDAFSPSSFRGAGIHPSWGVRNLVEFDYFPPSAAVSATFSAVTVATNNTRWAMVNLFPFELEPGPTHDIEVGHDALASRLELRVLKNGEPLAHGTSVLGSTLGDFRVDAFSITSYSGEHQPSGYGGGIVARGMLDDLEIEFPAPPVPRLYPPVSGSRGVVILPRSPGWTPVLERGNRERTWDSIPAIPVGDLETWTLVDPAPPESAAIYRVRLERP